MILPRIRPALLLAALLLAPAAHAQHVWLDENGRKQYSDIPPPASIPPHRILKQPGLKSLPPTSVDTGEAKKAAESSAPASLAEREADFRKRRVEQAEKDKKAAEEARIAEENKKRCASARDYLQSLEAGERIARRNSKGERQFLSDEERKKETAEAKRMLDACKQRS